jgi:hypothetical protein
MSNEDILVGMKEISSFLKLSRRVINRWMLEYPDIPIIKDGQLMANAVDLAEWQRRHVQRKKTEAVAG